MMNELPHSSLCSNVSKITVHRVSPMRRALTVAFFCLAYALILPSLYSTMGLPLERAILEAAKLAENQTLALEQEFHEEVYKESVVDWGEEETTTTETETAIPLTDFETHNIDVLSLNVTANATAAGQVERPLPSAYLPEALPLFLFFLVVCSTCLYFLMRQWFVWFMVMMEYEPFVPPSHVKTDHEDGLLFVHVIPLPHRGKPSLCALHKQRFEFQRQTYVWTFSTEMEANECLLMHGEEEAPLGETCANRTSPKTLEAANRVGFVRVLLARANLAIPVYLKQSQGLDSELELKERKRQFGLNTLAVPQPPFLQLLRTQLLMPLSVFQIFSALLWAVDEYLQYTIFSLFTIVLMESTTAFQRHKTMSQLRGLSAKSFNVWCRRMGVWVALPTEELVPGDVISLRTAPDVKQEVIIPCDLLLLEGSCVVNESTLTGESIPQMKDGLVQEDRALEVDGKDRGSVLFSGTSLVAFTSPENSEMNSPDLGVICLVLRTGFGSSQGELMQMIEFSNQAVSADNKETGVALAILLVFALMSATYVFQRGMEKGDRTSHELLLKCIIIVTSVVPRQLPVQMALAVNHALMALFSEGIFCTEPFRVPEAGKITMALFDKTGTLTADELTPIGITEQDGQELIPMNQANPEAMLVLGACHSLVVLEGKENEFMGDPIEVAAVRGVRWGFDGKRAFPNNISGLEQRLHATKVRVDTAVEGGVDKNKQVIATLKAEQAKLEQAIVALSKEKHKYGEGAEIETRFHFDATLQRMSVIVRIGGGGSNQVSPLRMVLCKGSPEAMKPLCTHKVPSNYDEIYAQLSERGMRVLALGFRPISGSVNRQEAEAGLTFCGFVAFEAKIRVDSAQVIQSLRQADIGVSMVTGDAPLTALHVATVCGFNSDKEALILSPSGTEWRGALRSSEHVVIPCTFAKENAGVLDLNKYTLIVTEEGLENLASLSQGNVWAGLAGISVFARMSPRGKAKVIRHLQKTCGRTVLMCGDGGNDVGALKQADVGLALLSGYGTANTAGGTSTTATTTTTTTPGSAEEALNESLAEQKKRAVYYGKMKKQELDIKRQALTKLQRVWIEEELQKLPEAERGIMASVSVMKQVAARLQRELQEESILLDKKYGLAVSSSSTAGDSLEQQLENANVGTGMPTIRPGDASVAAPFTSRVPSVRSVVHLIRQGRCTLLSSLQQQQIMMLECTISAYTYAMISLEGSRSSERQMMVSSWLIMAASLSFSYATPIDKMSAVKPLRSLFHPAVFLSIFGQAVIHLYSMSMAVRMATEVMGPEALAKVVAFNKAVAAGTVTEEANEEDPLKMLTQIWHKPFLPNLMNTTVFLVETAQIMSVLFVNYKGRPFMKGILENHTLFLSLFVCIGGVAFASWEVLPEFNRALHFYPFPNDEYRFRVVAQVVLVVCGTFLWDRLVIFFFARDVFRAMWEQALETKLVDLFPMVVSLFKVAMGFALLATGNPLVWMAAYYANRKFKEHQELEENKRLGLV